MTDSRAAVEDRLRHRGSQESSLLEQRIDGSRIGGPSARPGMFSNDSAKAANTPRKHWGSCAGTSSTPTKTPTAPGTTLKQQPLDLSSKRSVLPVSGVAAVGQAPSNSEPIRSGTLPAQGHRPVLAVDDASVRLARSHVHTGVTERLPEVGKRSVGPV